MIRSILAIPEEKLNALPTATLTQYDRNILKDVIDILEPFEIATKQIQAESTVYRQLGYSNSSGSPGFHEQYEKQAQLSAPDISPSLKYQTPQSVSENGNIYLGYSIRPKVQTALVF